VIAPGGASSPAKLVNHYPPMIAVDLGAGSCRVSLLRWIDGSPKVNVIHRFPNAPVQDGASLRWDFEAICSGVEEGLRLCADQSNEPIASIGVDGWAVDYVRLGQNGLPIASPFCYRDSRNEEAEAAVHARISESCLYELTGLQRLRFNTVYQLYADQIAGVSATMPWINLPEYLLYRLGARRVSEYTNATHTGLIDLKTRSWSTEIFDALGFDLAAAPELVASGTDVGKLQGPLAALPALRHTRLIAPACHDTASAIAGIGYQGGDCAYLSSGTWSLIGSLRAKPLNTEAAYRNNFTNLGAAGGRICFHKSVNGMWLIQQCMKQWVKQGDAQSLSKLIEAAGELNSPDALLDVDHPDLMLPGQMPCRINARRRAEGLFPIDEGAAGMRIFASLIFHSLAARYAQVAKELSEVTGQTFKALHVVGGGSRNSLLNRLTASTTGLELRTGHIESSTIGNLAIQLAAFDQSGPSSSAPSASGPSSEEIGIYADKLQAARFE
jgi:rhamnulokinase